MAADLSLSDSAEVANEEGEETEEEDAGSEVTADPQHPITTAVTQTISEASAREQSESASEDAATQVAASSLAGQVSDCEHESIVEPSRPLGSPTPPVGFPEVGTSIITDSAEVGTTKSLPIVAVIPTATRQRSEAPVASSTPPISQGDVSPSPCIEATI